MTDFLATSAVSGGGQITLAQLERAVARRCGPVRFGVADTGEVQSSTNAATTLIAYVDAFKSTANPSGITDLYLLRRGVKSDGSTVSVSADDRQRLVAAYDPLSNGAVTVDRLWGVAPVAGELMEFHHLNPATELRPSVVAGLRRCYFEDRVTVTLIGAAAERDLTAVLSWITKPAQVRRIQFSTVGSTAIPEDQDWWQPFESGGHVWLAGWRDAYPNTLYVTALRPHFTWVNGASSSTGPTADSDLLAADLDYAAAAGHIEAWRLCKSRLLQAGEAGFQDSQEAAAVEFSKQASMHVKPKRQEYGLSAPFSGGPVLSPGTY